MHARTRGSLVTFALSLAFACGGGHEKVSGEKPEPAKAEPSAAKADAGLINIKPEEVEASGIATAPAVEGTVIDTVSIQGRVVPRSGQSAAVVPLFPGRLVVGAGFPRIGQRVRQGQVLAEVVQELSATEVTTVEEKRIDLQSQVKQSEIDVAQKTKDYERSKTLYDGGVIALKQLQQAETDLGIARSRREMAAQSLARYDALQSGGASSPRRHALRAPIAGSITTVNAAPNQPVDTSKPVFEIVNLDPVWVEAQVFEDLLPAVRRARSAEITTRAAPDLKLKGTLVSLTHQMDPTTKTEGVNFETPNPGGVLAVGMNVQVTIPSGTARHGVLVPSSAVLEQQGHTIVFVERQPNAFETREVELGHPQGDKAVILKGVARAEKVVVAGAQSVAAAAEPEHGGSEK
jgi:cobalt-zinc-cadmium efflux system membrane fusion protein